MKKILFKNIQLTLGFIIIFSGNILAQVGFGTNSPNASAILDVTSTSKGFLPPRMTYSQVLAIVNPVAGLTVYCNDCGGGEIQVYNGSKWTNSVGGTAKISACETSTITFSYNGNIVTYKTVTSANNKCWLKRNLGATTDTPTNNSDPAAYGDLFQWGRSADGHQIITNTTYGSPTSSNTPAGNFIINSTSGQDWRSPSNDNLWQGVNGINNPCPSGFRLPTLTELDNERASWSSTAYASPLQLTFGGWRDKANGSVSLTGSNGFYWCSTPVTSSGSSNILVINGGGASSLSTLGRCYGLSVRCIKD